MRPEREHRPGCPRLQFWDAGEWQAPCLCDDEPLAPPWRSPLFWVAVAFLVGALIALFFWVTPAQAQELEPDAAWTLEDELALQRGEISGEGPAVETTEPRAAVMRLLSRLGANPGVGLELAAGTSMCWEGGTAAGRFPLVPEARPWGDLGTGPLESEALQARYHGGTSRDASWPCGQAAELFEAGNGLALHNAYQGKCSALDNLLSREGRDGTPTREEKYDLALSQPRCGQVYRQCWWDLKAGGSPELAIPVETAIHWRTFQNLVDPLPCETGVVKARSVMCNWPTYYDVRYLPEARPWCGEPDPPPEPEPEPDPVGPPECSPACKHLALAIQEADKRYPRAYRLPDGTADLCDGEPEDPPRDDCRWRFWPTHVWERIGQLQAQCRADVESGCKYVPGLPSTGRTPLVLESEAGHE